MIQEIQKSPFCQDVMRWTTNFDVQCSSLPTLLRPAALHCPAHAKHVQGVKLLSAWSRSRKEIYWQYTLAHYMAISTTITTTKFTYPPAPAVAFYPDLSSHTCSPTDIKSIVLAKPTSSSWNSSLSPAFPSINELLHLLLVLQWIEPIRFWRARKGVSSIGRLQWLGPTANPKERERDNG